MATEFIYQFEEHGLQLEPDEVGKDSLYVDIGNCLANGIIDHHQLRGTDVTSTVKAFKTDYIKHLRNKDKVMIYTHECPDLDALLATYMSEFAITHNDKEFSDVFAKGNYGYELIRYVDEIDSGRGKKISKEIEKPSLYLIACFLDKIVKLNSWMKNNPNEDIDKFDYAEYKKSLSVEENVFCNLESIKLGHKLISYILEKLEACSFTIINEQAIAWDTFIDDEKIAEYFKKLLTNDYEIYKKERKTAIEFRDIYVWKKDEQGNKNKNVGKVKVRAAIWQEPPKSEFNYLYARKYDNAVITAIPYQINNECIGEKGLTDVIISVDSDNCAYKNITLKPLAEALELLEQIEEKDYFKNNGSWRRDHSRCRNGFEEAPFCATENPWFYTTDEYLVQGPRGFSLIKYDKIATILKNHTSLIKSLYINNDPFEKEFTIAEWIRTVSEKINNSNEYNVIISELDVDMIKSRNDVLKALCLSPLGNNIFEEKKFLEPDYYSCIYADENNFIMLFANVRDEENSNDALKLRTRRLHDIASNTEELKKKISKIVKVVKRHKDKLYEIGSKLTNCVNDSNKAREVYEEYVSFLAQEQKDSMFNTLIECEIYDYLRTELRINDYKDSIKDAVDIVTTYSKEKVYSIFNWLSVITVPFVIISTFFQMGMIDFEPLITSKMIHSDKIIFDENISSYSTLLEWSCVIVGTIIIIVFFWLYNNKKRKNNKKP